MAKTATYPDREAGFTLLELIVSLAIISLVLTATTVLVSGPRPAAELRAAESKLMNTMREARAHAITLGVDVEVIVDVEAREISLEGAEPLSLGEEELGIEFTTARGLTAGGRRGAVLFFPDGSSTGGRIVLYRDQARSVLDIDWMTGRAYKLEANDVGG